MRIGFIGPDHIEFASFELSSFEPTSPSQKYVAEANTVNDQQQINECKQPLAQ